MDLSMRLPCLRARISQKPSHPLSRACYGRRLKLDARAELRREWALTLREVGA